LNIHPFASHTLHATGLPEHSVQLKRILEPITKTNFAVLNAVSQVMVDETIKLFDPSMHTGTQWGILYEAVRHSQDDTRVLELLLSVGINPDMPSNNNWRASHLCGGYAFLKPADVVFLCPTVYADKELPQGYSSDGCTEKEI
jgi:hypothetical protein